MVMNSLYVLCVSSSSRTVIPPKEKAFSLLPRRSSSLLFPSLIGIEYLVCRGIIVERLPYVDLNLLLYSLDLHFYLVVLRCPFQDLTLVLVEDGNVYPYPGAVSRCQVPAVSAVFSAHRNVGYPLGLGKSLRHTRQI